MFAEMTAYIKPIGLLHTIKLAIWWSPALVLVWYILRCLYRISPLHPLYNFPGPKITAINRWYEAYCEVWKDGTGGKFTDQIEEWHRQYGPIVRINPFELHVDDPDYYDVLFSFDSHLWKRTFAIGTFPTSRT